MKATTARVACHTSSPQQFCHTWPIAGTARLPTRGGAERNKFAGKQQTTRRPVTNIAPRRFNQCTIEENKWPMQGQALLNGQAVARIAALSQQAAQGHCCTFGLHVKTKWTTGGIHEPAASPPACFDSPQGRVTATLPTPIANITIPFGGCTPSSNPWCPHQELVSAAAAYLRRAEE